MDCTTTVLEAIAARAQYDFGPGSSTPVRTLILPGISLQRRLSALLTLAGRASETVLFAGESCSGPSAAALPEQLLDLAAGALALLRAISPERTQETLLSEVSAERIRLSETARAHGLRLRQLPEHDLLVTALLAELGELAQALLNHYWKSAPLHDVRRELVAVCAGCAWWLERVGLPRTGGQS